MELNYEKSLICWYHFFVNNFIIERLNETIELALYKHNKFLSKT